MQDLAIIVGIYLFAGLTWRNVNQKRWGAASFCALVCLNLIVWAAAGRLA